MQKITSTNSTSLSYCYDIIEPSQLYKYPVNRKYKIVELYKKKDGNSIETASSKDNKNKISETQLVYLVPKRFPFIFVIEKNSSILQDPARLDSKIRKLNVMKRIQLVHSVIPPKALLKTFLQIRGEKIGHGRIRINTICPLTSNIIKKSILHFNLLKEFSQKLEQSVMSIGSDGSKHDSASSVSLDSKCTLLEFEVDYKTYNKSQTSVLHFDEKDIVSDKDLFYGLINLKSGVSLKLYFTPATRSVEPLGANSTKQKLYLYLSKVHLVAVDGLDKDIEPQSVHTFNTAIKKNHFSDQESNYRFDEGRKIMQIHSEFVPAVIDRFESRGRLEKEISLANVQTKEENCNRQTLENPLEIREKDALFQSYLRIHPQQEYTHAYDLSSNTDDAAFRKFLRIQEEEDKFNQYPFEYSEDKHMSYAQYQPHLWSNFNKTANKRRDEWKEGKQNEGSTGEHNICERTEHPALNSSLRLVGDGFILDKKLSDANEDDTASSNQQQKHVSLNNAQDGYYCQSSSTPNQRGVQNGEYYRILKGYSINNNGISANNGNVYTRPDQYQHMSASGNLHQDKYKSK